MKRIDIIHNTVGKQKSVVPIICVLVTRMFDCSECTEIRKIPGAIWLIYFIFEPHHEKTCLQGLRPG